MSFLGDLLPKEHFCKATFHFGQIGSKRHLQTSKTTDANDEKCRSDANLMKEVERGHLILGVNPKFSMAAMGNLFQK
jgi:hypothetical protein